MDNKLSALSGYRENSYYYNQIFYKLWGYYIASKRFFKEIKAEEGFFVVVVVFFIYLFLFIFSFIFSFLVFICESVKNTVFLFFPLTFKFCLMADANKSVS